jgi:hypothetical protein
MVGSVLTRGGPREMKDKYTFNTMTRHHLVQVYRVNMLIKKHKMVNIIDVGN